MLKIFSSKVLETAFFSDEKLFQVKQQYKTENDVLYVPKTAKKRDIPDERINREQSGFPQKVMLSVAISKAGKTLVLFVDPGAKVDSKYYTLDLLKKMIPQMNRLAQGDYLFMQDGARSHTFKLTLNHLGKYKHLKLLEPHQWPPNSPDLNPLDYSTWRMLETNVYHGRRINRHEYTETSHRAKLPQDVITKSIDTFRERLKRVVEVQGRHIEKYL